MLYFKSCVRCSDGTVELGKDNFGSYLRCIVCGYTINSKSIRDESRDESDNQLTHQTVNSNM